MQKTLLKMLTYELVERVARFDSLLVSLSQDCDPTSSPLLIGMQERLDDIKRDILGEKKFLFRMFDEKSVKTKDFQASLPTKLNNAVYRPYEALCELSGWLPSLGASPSLTMVPEVSMFLQDALADKYSQGVGRRAVVFQPEMMATRPELQGFSDVFLETLPYLQRSNPLGWLGLTEGYVKALIEREEQPVFKTLQTKAKGLLAEDLFFRSLVKHCIALRLLGPAYYYYAVSDALLQRDVIFLEKIEPALFYGLNYFNFIDKSLVILHEATEKSRELFDFSTSGSSSERLFLEEQVNSVLEAVEKVIPEGRAFTEKHFSRALALQERLNQSTLISAASVYSAGEVVERLNKALLKEEEPTSESTSSTSVYDMLTLVTETPNSPREIINAGWLHKLERSPIWLYDSLSSEGAQEKSTQIQKGSQQPRCSMDGFHRLAERLALSDHLLLKSIETSEIHRVLLTTV